MKQVCRRCNGDKEYRGMDGCIAKCLVCYIKPTVVEDTQIKPNIDFSDLEAKINYIDIHSSSFKRSQDYRDAIQNIMRDANVSRKTAQRLYNQQFN